MCDTHSSYCSTIIELFPDLTSQNIINTQLLKPWSHEGCVCTALSVYDSNKLQLQLIYRINVTQWLHLNDFRPMYKGGCMWCQIWKEMFVLLQVTVRVAYTPSNVLLVIGHWILFYKSNAIYIENLIIEIAGCRIG